MDVEQVKEKLGAIFVKLFKEEGIEIRDEMTAADVDRWDSLTHLDLISTIEKEFKIKFKLKELVNMKNVGDLVRGIAAKA